MKVDEARERVLEIRRIVERTTLWTLLPSTAAIIGGLLVSVLFTVVLVPAAFLLVYGDQTGVNAS